MIGVALSLPFLPFAGLAGLVPVPATLLGAMCLITALYVGATEIVKVGFYRAARLSTGRSGVA